MTRKIVYTENAPAPVGPYSQAIQANDFLYISGQIPVDPKTGKVNKETFEIECRLVLDNLKAVVEAGGSSLDKVVKVNIYLKDMSKFAELNKIYAEYFNDSKPARACVQVGMLPLDVDVEIEAVALV